MRELVRVGDSEESEFAGVEADELQPDRQVGFRETARNGNSGNAGEIGRPVEAKEQGPREMVFFRDSNAFLSD